MEETDDRRLERLLKTSERLVLALEGRQEDRSVDVKVDNRIDNKNPERAAWVCSIMCAVAVTIAVLQAFQIQSLQSKYDRTQDYLNYIYQQAPHLRPPEKK